MNQTTPIGKIIAISDLNVTILATGQNAKNRDILATELDGKEHLFEVSDVKENQLSCIPLSSVIGLKKGLDVYKKSESLDVQYNDNILGRFSAPMEILLTTVPSRKERNVPSIPETCP